MLGENLVALESFLDEVEVVDGAVDVETRGGVVFNVYDKLFIFVAYPDDVC